MTRQSKPFARLEGQVQHYPWGGTEFLSHWRGIPNPQQQSQAEYWLGTHPAAPSHVLPDSAEGPTPLADFLATHHAPPLQFLLKILDVRDMLSIQVHPNLAQARQGFARENAAGIDLKAAHRNYKDTSDKPELMVALSEFWLLHGFCPLDQLTARLKQSASLQPLARTLAEQGLGAAFARALDLDDPTILQMHHSVAEQLLAMPQLSDKHHIHFWMQRWLQQHPSALKGLLTLYFLNLVKLQMGEAIYQPAGLLHAYLEGQNVELMANSDNVLRAGLTSKHIDVAELLAIAQIVPSAPADYCIQPVDTGAERLYPTPFPNFVLSQIHADVRWQVTQPEILLVYRGGAQLCDTTGDSLKLQQGDSVLLAPGMSARLTVLTADTLLFKARNLSI